MPLHRTHPEANATGKLLDKTSRGMPKYGFIISIIMSIIYVLISGFLIKSALSGHDDGEENHNVMKWSVSIILLLLTIINLIIYFSKDKSTDDEKEDVNEIVGWVAISPLVVILICFVIMIMGTTSRVTYVP